MKKIFNIFSLIAVSASLLCGCKGELVDTNQYAEAGVALNVYGPQPVMRGVNSASSEAIWTRLRR